MAEKKEAQFGSLEDLFAADLDDIADLASFETPPVGAYLLKVSTDLKEINEKDAVEVKITVLETVELAVTDPDAKKYRAPVKDGTECSMAFILGNAVAEGRLKQFLAPFAEHFGSKNVGVLIRDTIKDVTIAASITNRQDKEDPERFYMGLKNIIIS